MGRRPSTNTVRNRNGIWVNTELFRTEARHFEKYGYYTAEPMYSPGWYAYWREQENRCINGYCVGGACITGFHYFYLNFIRIMAFDEKAGRKIRRFPDFWDGDYNYFWAVEIAMRGITKKKLKQLKLAFNVHPDYLDGGHNIIVAKARRKGYSYKNAAIVAAIYNFFPESLTIIGSYLYNYATDTFKKAKRYIDFINENTAWTKNVLSYEKGRYIQSGYKENINGVWVDKGYLSEIVALSYESNPDPSRGKDARFVALEEVGTFPNIQEAYHATEPVTKDGGIKTGIIAMYGTSSMMEHTQQFEEIFYNPTDYNALPFENIWEKEEEDRKTYVGFFHPAHWNKVGYMDKNGNSFLKEAYESEMKERASKNSPQALIGHIVEYPLSPSEAFMQKDQTFFPINELKRQLSKVINEKLYLHKSTPVHLYYDEGKVKYEVIFDRDKIEPLYFYNQKANDYSGVVLMYEPPIDNPPFGLYKIGYDPYAQDKGESLAAIYVYKGFLKGDQSRDKIVASYVGRPQDIEETNRIALMLAELYNTEVMYENMFIHVKHYFRKKNKLNRLAAQPDGIISKAIKESRVQRIYGIHMTPQIKEAGEKYIAQWLMTERDFVEGDDGQATAVYNYELIYDPGLLQELIKYNRKVNTDRVIALMMVMFQKEEDMGREYDSESQYKWLEEIEDYVRNHYKLMN